MDRKIVIYDYSPSARELVKNLKFSTDSLIVVARTREEYEAAHEDGLELFLPIYRMIKTFEISG